MSSGGDAFFVSLGSCYYMLWLVGVICCRLAFVLRCGLL